MTNVASDSKTPKNKYPSAQQRREYQKRRALIQSEAKKIVATASKRSFPERCSACGDESCQYFVGLGVGWVDEMLGLIALIASATYPDDTLESMAHDGPVQDMALDALRRMVKRINRHIGGAPRFPLSNPLIDGQDREWALTRRKAV